MCKLQAYYRDTLTTSKCLETGNPSIVIDEYLQSVAFTCNWQSVFVSPLRRTHNKLWVNPGDRKRLFWELGPERRSTDLVGNAEPPRKRAKMGEDMARMLLETYADPALSVDDRREMCVTMMSAVLNFIQGHKHPMPLQPSGLNKAGGAAAGGGSTLSRRRSQPNVGDAADKTPLANGDIWSLLKATAQTMSNFVEDHAKSVLSGSTAVGNSYTRNETVDLLTAFAMSTPHDDGSMASVYRAQRLALYSVLHLAECTPHGRDLFGTTIDEWLVKLEQLEEEARMSGESAPPRSSTRGAWDDLDCGTLDFAGMMLQNAGAEYQLMTAMGRAAFHPMFMEWANEDKQKLQDLLNTCDEYQRSRVSAAGQVLDYGMNRDGGQGAAVIGDEDGEDGDEDGENEDGDDGDENGEDDENEDDEDGENEDDE